jgi:hypothetical protein
LSSLARRVTEKGYPAAKAPGRKAVGLKRSLKRMAAAVAEVIRVARSQYVSRSARTARVVRLLLFGQRNSGAPLYAGQNFAPARLIFDARVITLAKNQALLLGTLFPEPHWKYQEFETRCVV